MEAPQSSNYKPNEPKDEINLAADNTLPGSGSGSFDTDMTHRIDQACDLLSDKASGMIGRVLNEHFEILSLIGEGGMSHVYKARDTLLKKTVAVKMLHPRLLLQPSSIRRLQQEALAASSLDHPNTVAFRHFDISQDSEPYLVMAYLEGKSLADVLITEGRLPPARAIKILTQMAEALAYAHSKGIVHRDLKSSNVLLVNHAGTPDFVKIVDFGIAKVMAPEGVAAPAHLTTTGEIFGSPMVMSPEQCLGEQTDARSDIYSFGCLMYEMLTGSQVFPLSNTLEILFKQVHEMPDSFKLANPKAKIDPQLEAITFKCLRKSPQQRYQSMRDLLDDFSRLDSGGTVDQILARVGLATHDKRHIRKAQLAGIAAVFLSLSSMVFLFERYVDQFFSQQKSLVDQVVGWQSSGRTSVEPPTSSHQPLSPADRITIKSIQQQAEASKENAAPALSAEQENKIKSNILLLAPMLDGRDSADMQDVAASLIMSAVVYGNHTGKDTHILKTITETGDKLFSANLFMKSSEAYRAALQISQNIPDSNSADDKCFHKLEGDCEYAMGEYQERPMGDSYENAAIQYAYFFADTPQQSKLPTIVDLKTLAQFNGKAISSWLFKNQQNDLVTSPFAFDAYRKYADCEYLRQTNKDYALAWKYYQRFESWRMSHASIPETHLGDVEALVLCREADCQRMASLVESGDRSKINVVNDVFVAYKKAVDTLRATNASKERSRNIALCHSYLAAWADKYGLSPAIDLTIGGSSKEITLPVALVEMEDQFGSDDRATLLVERAYADSLHRQANHLWQTGQYLPALESSCRALTTDVRMISAKQRD